MPAPDASGRSTGDRATDNPLSSPLESIANRGTLGTSTDVRDAQLAAIASLTGVTTSLKLGALTGDEIGVVLRHVEQQVERFETAPGPLTAKAIADDLLEAYRVLRERERQSPRGPGGELLKSVRQTGDPIRSVPWTPSRPTRLEDVTGENAARPFF